MQTQIPLVALQKLPYAGRDFMPGELFHVEHPDHALLFKSDNRARDPKPAELKTKAAQRVETPPPLPAEVLAQADLLKAQEKDLDPERPGKYKTRDMGVETAGSKVTKSE